MRAGRKRKGKMGKRKRRILELEMERKEAGRVSGRKSERRPGKRVGRSAGKRVGRRAGKRVGWRAGRRANQLFARNSLAALIAAAR
jgi:hypothetical protein